MVRKDRPLLLAKPDAHPVAADDHVHRLREMLRIMAPEHRTPALGAGIVVRGKARPEDQHDAEPQRSRTSDVADAA
jgi:hypothetical protein